MENPPIAVGGQNLVCFSGEIFRHAILSIDWKNAKA
jgi:hypothetical protein